ncbi:hypothetical protein N8E89_28505 (plasmid) [Phyllobacterium sp. A18/5-2]|nr:hypothetical protein [Phyllobacterium sp. A18/5-2]UXN67459.1 hypothetical protein N8E89_28505 [Phyllobacterium sp. A18/5-2]
MGRDEAKTFVSIEKLNRSSTLSRLIAASKTFKAAKCHSQSIYGGQNARGGSSGREAGNSERRITP